MRQALQRAPRNSTSTSVPSSGLLVTASSNRYNQSVVEAATIFTALSVVTLPAYIFAVFSEKATSKIIWFLAAFCWGANFGGIHWYTASHDGLTGVISWQKMAWPFTIFAVLLLLSVLSRLRWKMIAKVLQGSSFVFLGYTMTVAR